MHFQRKPKSVISIFAIFHNIGQLLNEGISKETQFLNGLFEQTNKKSQKLFPFVKMAERQEGLPIRLKWRNRELSLLGEQI